MAKDGVRRVLTRCFEHIDGSTRIDIEIKKRDVFGFVVRWLGSTMDDPVESLLRKQLKDLRSIADVDIVMLEMSRFSLEQFEIPGCASLRAKKGLPHIVVDT
jgi:hypothetical protein